MCGERNGFLLSGFRKPTLNAHFFDSSKHGNHALLRYPMLHRSSRNWQSLKSVNGQKLCVYLLCVYSVVLVSANHLLVVFCSSSGRSIPDGFRKVSITSLLLVEVCLRVDYLQIWVEKHGLRAVWITAAASACVFLLQFDAMPVFLYHIPTLFFSPPEATNQGTQI